MFGGPIEHRPRLCALLDDARIIGLCNEVLGEDFNYASGDGNYYSGDTGWHPDGNLNQLFAVKIAFYLDPLARDSGCLRVLPGSHHPDHFVRAQHIDLNNAQALFGVEPRDMPGNLALETQPGDLVIFNHDLYHASFGGSTRRRMFTMNLTRPCSTQRTWKRCASMSASAHRWRTAWIWAGMLSYRTTSTAGPQRMRHLRQCADLHDELFPQFARK